jgi:formylmethanofuran dehydrogenase subunit E
MKTYLECLSEAAALIGKPHISAAIKLELSDDELALLQEAADMYAEQSNSHKPVVVRGGDSENQFVQHVGKYFDYKNVNTTPNTPTELLPAEGSAKSVCGEKPAHNWIQLANDDIICTECGMQLRASLKLWLNI